MLDTWTTPHPLSWRSGQCRTVRTGSPGVPTGQEEPYMNHVPPVALRLAHDRASTRPTALASPHLSCTQLLQQTGPFPLIRPGVCVTR